MRGREKSLRTATPVVGNTPASAGKSRLPGHHLSTCRKYPRECGEEVDPDAVGFRTEEIPPRVRGREIRATLKSLHEGNTPASAGKSPKPGAFCSGYGKYPRECGEEREIRILSRPYAEIPPRVRGRVGALRAECCKGGNTPASAGKRSSSHATRYWTWKYPRECGEEAYRHSVYALCAGNTPASAGKSSQDFSLIHQARKYPRECGEERLMSTSFGITMEIPPRVRGRVRGLGGQPAAHGNTPASAGKSTGHPVALVQLGKYPRECGEEGRP